MTPVQIAYFKHFLFDRGIQAIYISMYKRNRIKGGPEEDKNGNPESLEQFLQEQPPFRVLMHAFYFQANSDFGYDYWKDINKKWEKYLKLHEDNPQNDKAVVLKGSFAILRQNWDSSQYWKIETMEATYKRMHMEPPLKGVDLEKAFYVPRSNHSEESQEEDNEQRKFKVGDIIQSSISNEVLTITAIKDKWYEANDGGVIDFDKEDYWTKIDEVVECDENHEDASEENTEAEDYSSFSLEGFSEVNTSNIHGGKRMDNDTVSVNTRNNGYRITFPTKQSTKIRDGGFQYMKFLTNKSANEIAFMFNNQNGCSICNKKNKSATNNITINSKDMIEHIYKFYNIKKSVGYFTLRITACVQQNSSLIYKLTLSE